MTKKLTLVNILFLGLFCRSLSFIMMPIVPDIYYFLFAAIFFTLFNSVVQPSISTLISLNTSPAEQGKMAGINSSYLSLSNAIGPPIAGAIVTEIRPQTYGYPLYLAGICTFIVLFFAFQSRRKFTPKAIGSAIG